MDERKSAGIEGALPGKNTCGDDFKNNKTNRGRIAAKSM